MSDVIYYFIAGFVTFVVIGLIVRMIWLDSIDSRVKQREMQRRELEYKKAQEEIINQAVYRVDVLWSNHTGENQCPVVSGAAGKYDFKWVQTKTTSKTNKTRKK